jgi:ABC-2 type transport system permease protein
VRKVLAIAQVTWREAVRNRVLYSLLVFAAALLTVAGVLDHMTLGQSGRVVLDLGLAGAHLCGAAIAIFLGVALVSQDIARKTVHVVLAKPVGRGAYLAGKYLGLILTLAVIMAIMGMAVGTGAYLLGSPPGLAYLFALGMIWVELAVVTAIAVLFAAFTGPFLAGMFTLGLFVIGHLTRGLEALAAAGDSPILGALTRVLHLGLPDLEKFDFKAAALYGTIASPADAGLALLYGLGCALALLAVAGAVFTRRDFH